MMRKHIVPGSVAALLAATGLVFASPAAAQSGFSLTTGVDVSTGKYGGSSSTDIVYVPFTGKYEIDKWVFKLTVPYILVTGPGNVVRDIGIVKGRKAGTRKTESGLGDVVAGVTRNIIDIDSTGTLVDLTGKVKFGTADAGKGLGTGQNDYAIQGDVTQRVTSAISVFGSLGYKWIGSPAGAQLSNVVYGEAGAAFRISEDFRVGAFVDASQAPSTSGPQREVTGYVTEQLTNRFKAQAYVVHGFANGSPDWGGGAMVTFAF